MHTNYLLRTVTNMFRDSEAGTMGMVFAPFANSSNCAHFADNYVTVYMNGCTDTINN